MGIFYNKEKDDVKIGAILMAIAFLTITIIVVSLAIGPIYNVWKMKLGGEAQLREAEYSKQVLIEQAKADLESAKLWRVAEVERAKGVAESTEIISERLQKNEAYLLYLAIQAQMKMADSPNHTAIYIPVGAMGIPLIKEIGE